MAAMNVTRLDTLRAASDAEPCGLRADLVHPDLGPLRVSEGELGPGASLNPDTALAHLVVVRAGSGKLLSDGAPQPVHSPCVLSLTAGTQHRLSNNGCVPLVWTLLSRTTG